MADRRQPTRPPGTGHSSVRRNLFNSNPSRRLASSNTSSHQSNSTAAHLDTVLGVSADDSSSEILVRNANGDYAVAMPAVPPLVADAATSNGNGAAGEEEAADEEVESRLAELLNNRTRQSTEQELVEAVRANLRRKIDALAEDRWIFEGERNKP